MSAAWQALNAATPAGRPWDCDDGGETLFAAPIADGYRAHRGIPRNLAHLLDRGSAIALDAALQALDSAGLGAGAGDARRFGVVDGLPYRAPGQPTLFVPYGHMVARALGVRGPVNVVAGGEASGAAAIVAAARLIVSGEADVVVAGAAQALQRPLLGHLRDQGHASLSSARPFDREHAGFVPAEGAAYVVVEAAAHAQARGATAVARLEGTSEMFDSTVEPLATSDASEAGRVQQLALGNAGYLQNQVDLVVSCADGRPAVDFADGLGLQRTFGRHAFFAGVTSVGGVFGCALGASGPLSLVAALEAMRQQAVFPLAGFGAPEDGLDLAYVRESRPERTGCVLVTSMGTGGTNVALLLQR